MSNTRYNQANILTIIAMWMIVTIHYFNNFGELIESNKLLLFVSILRGTALVAVPIYLLNTGYTNLYLGKKVNFSKIFFYIIIPTILLTQINLRITSDIEMSWTISEGFASSWFGDMYIGLMLFMPLMQYFYYVKNWKKQLFYISIPFLIFSFYYSIGKGSTLNQLGNFVFLPYIPLIIVITYLTFETKSNNKIVLTICTLISILLMSYCYYGFYQPQVIDKSYFISYFGPLSVVTTVCISKLFYFSNFHIDGIRFISRSSYFLYFTHYTIIKIYKLYFFESVSHHILRYYVLAIILSFILSSCLFYIYDKLLNILKLS